MVLKVKNSLYHLPYMEMKMNAITEERNESRNFLSYSSNRARTALNAFALQQLIFAPGKELQTNLTRVKGVKNSCFYCSLPRVLMCIDSHYNQVYSSAYYPEYSCIQVNKVHTPVPITKSTPVHRHTTHSVPYTQNYPEYSCYCLLHWAFSALSVFGLPGAAALF